MEKFSPFPLRARGVIEQFDAAIKLYKQYFWVLLGWSALVTIASVVSGIIGFFLTPIAVGAVVCCVAAAIRGENVEFSQCWRFTQTRYWQALLYSFLASLIGAIAVAILVGVVLALFIMGAATLRGEAASVQIVIGLCVLIPVGTLVTIVSTVLISWFSLVPIVVCMEDDKRNSASLSRAYDLLRGNWLRITSLMALVGAAVFALFGILGGLTVLLVGVNTLHELLSGRPSESAAMSAMLALFGFGAAYTLLWMLWTPLYYLILTVFYLDVRVQREALDLEWTAHTTNPAMQSQANTPSLSLEKLPIDSAAPPFQQALDAPDDPIPMR